MKRVIHHARVICSLPDLWLRAQADLQSCFEVSITSCSRWWSRWVYFESGECVSCFSFCHYHWSKAGRSSVKVYMDRKATEDGGPFIPNVPPQGSLWLNRESFQCFLYSERWCSLQLCRWKWNFGQREFQMWLLCSITSWPVPVPVNQGWRKGNIRSHWIFFCSNLSRGEFADTWPVWVHVDRMMSTLSARLFISSEAEWWNLCLTWSLKIL